MGWNDKNKLEIFLTFTDFVSDTKKNAFDFRQSQTKPLLFQAHKLVCFFCYSASAVWLFVCMTNIESVLSYSPWEVLVVSLPDAQTTSHILPPNEELVSICNATIKHQHAVRLSACWASAQGSCTFNNLDLLVGWSLRHETENNTNNRLCDISA